MNYLLIPKFGYKSAAIATLSSYCFMVIFQYFVIIRFYPLTWEWKRLIRIVILTGVLFLTWKWSGEKWLVGIINLGLYPILLWVSQFFTPAEKQFIQSNIRHK